MLGRADPARRPYDASDRFHREGCVFHINNDIICPALARIVAIDGTANCITKVPTKTSPFCKVALILFVFMLSRIGSD